MAGPATSTVSATTQPLLRSPRRLLLAFLGIVCVGLAVAGAVLPGLPATVFLILASYLFTRSCPWLEERLIRNRLFGPYLKYLDGRQPMPRRARWIAAISMWIAVATSLGMLALSGALGPWGGGSILASGLVGSVVISRYRR
jgi:uncharacterized membrane protein YbaN (DUF454 family)